LKADNGCAYLHFAGLMGYVAARDLQRRWAAARAEARVPDTLMLLQHPHTFTLGRSATIDHLLMNETERAAKGVGLYEADRGGDITYHGPGQLVGYPILCLGRPAADGHLSEIDFSSYLRRIEEVLIRALAEWGISAMRIQGFTGVWVKAEGFGKIAAIGVKVDGQGVSQHGFALNVAPDMSYFDGIVPCGIRHRGVISMAQLLDHPPDLDSVAAIVAEKFGEVFNLNLVRVNRGEVERVLCLI
jgi:lipoate-protein ligase B